MDLENGSNFEQKVNQNEESGINFGSITGSFLWMAPEVVFQKPIGRRSDIWSLGCTIIELASGNYPWAGIKDLADFFSLLEQRKLPDIPDHLSEECKDFILKCLNYDKNMRPNAE